VIATLRSRELAPEGHLTSHDVPPFSDITDYARKSVTESGRNAFVVEMTMTGQANPVGARPRSALCSGWSAVETSAIRQPVYVR
jgi:hypothetical protein